MFLCAFQPPLFAGVAAIYKDGRTFGGVVNQYHEIGATLGTHEWP